MGATLILWGMKALGFLKGVPREVWLILAALAAVWLYGSHREASGYAEGSAHVQAQWDKAKAAGEKARKAEEARQANLSKGADRAIIENTASERDRTERFIAAGGVRERSCPRAVSGPLPSAGEREVVREAPVVDEREALPTVAVTPEDVRICTDNTVKAEAWRELLLKLESGAAKVAAGE